MFRIVCHVHPHRGFNFVCGEVYSMLLGDCQLGFHFTPEHYSRRITALIFIALKKQYLDCAYFKGCHG